MDKTPNPDPPDYRGRYPFFRERQGIWREIARYVWRDTGPVGTLVELGAGFCDFVNQFPARRKIAFDLNPDMVEFAAPDVDLRIRPAEAVAELGEESVDLIFASNFLEHLTRPELDRLLPILHRTLRPAGRLILLQPNYRRCASQYFVDETHQTVFTDRTLAEFLARFGFRTVRRVPGLLPFSMKSRLPKWPILTRLFLRSPWRPMGAQMYVVAEKEVRHLER